MNELSQVLNKDLSYIDDIFLNQIRDPNLPISDIKLVQQAIRRSGRRMVTIGILISKSSQRKYSGLQIRQL